MIIKVKKVVHFFHFFAEGLTGILRKNPKSLQNSSGNLPYLRGPLGPLRPLGPSEAPEGISNPQILKITENSDRSHPWHFGQGPILAPGQKGYKQSPYPLKMPKSVTGPAPDFLARPKADP